MRADYLRSTRYPSDLDAKKRDGRRNEWPPNFSHCAVAKTGADAQKGASREAEMVLIPIVLAIGGILALVYWLDKRGSPWPK
jgi:hypothetical protein